MIYLVIVAIEPFVFRNSYILLALLVTEQPEYGIVTKSGFVSASDLFLPAPAAFMSKKIIINRSSTFAAFPDAPDKFIQFLIIKMVIQS